MTTGAALAISSSELPFRSSEKLEAGEWVVILRMKRTAVLDRPRPTPSLRSVLAMCYKIPAQVVAELET